MKKRIITVLLALTLLLCLSVSVFAASQLWNITDDVRAKIAAAKQK